MSNLSRELYISNRFYTPRSKTNDFEQKLGELICYLVATAPNWLKFLYKINEILLN